MSGVLGLIVAALLWVAAWRIYSNPQWLDEHGPGGDPRLLSALLAAGFGLMGLIVLYAGIVNLI